MGAGVIRGRKKERGAGCVGADVGVPHVSDRKEKERSARAGLLARWAELGRVLLRVREEKGEVGGLGSLDVFF